MRKALKREPSFAQHFVTYLIHRTSRVEADLIDQLFNSSERRLARLLLLLAHFGKEGVPQPIDIEISQETLADMIGTTRSRVSFFMNKFRKLGFISYNGKIHVHSSLLNTTSQHYELMTDGEFGFVKFFNFESLRHNVFTGECCAPPGSKRGCIKCPKFSPSSIGPCCADSR
jgi:Crp-like helix-turn-helix domain